MYITSSISASAASGNSREANEDGSLFIFCREERSSGDVGPVTVGSEYTMGTGTTGMDGTLGNLSSQLMSVDKALSAIKDKRYSLAHDQNAESSGGR